MRKVDGRIGHPECDIGVHLFCSRTRGIQNVSSVDY